MRERSIEIAVGLFMLAGFAALLMLALKVSGLTSFITQKGYVLSAKFDNIGDLKPRAPVTMAGVRIGEVSSIRLDKESYKAVVKLRIAHDQNTLPKDSSASIYTQGLLGSNYISLTPGFENTFLQEGDRIQSTHSALILENLIGDLIFSLGDSGKKDSGKNKEEHK